MSDETKPAPSSWYERYAGKVVHPARGAIRQPIGLKKARRMFSVITENECSGRRMTLREVADRFRCSVCHVKHCLDLLRLPAEVQALVARGKIVPRIATLLVRVPGHENELAREVMAMRYIDAVKVIRIRAAEVLLKNAPDAAGRSAAAVPRAANGRRDSHRVAPSNGLLPPDWRPSVAWKNEWDELIFRAVTVLGPGVWKFGQMRAAGFCSMRYPDDSQRSSSGLGLIIKRYNDRFFRMPDGSVLGLSIEGKNRHRRYVIRLVESASGRPPRDFLAD